MTFWLTAKTRQPWTMDNECEKESRLTKEYDAARCKALGVKVVDGYKAIES